MPTIEMRQGPAPDEFVIRPPTKWGGDSLLELFRFRELVYFLTKRELQVRYRQSLFGAGWALLQPLAMTVIFALVFGHLARISSDGIPYPIFALTALVPWLFVSQTVTQGANSLVGDAALLAKVYFPRLAIPVAKSAALVVDLAIALCVLFIVAAAYGIYPTPTTLILPAFLLLAILTALGAAILLAAINVKYRDVAVAVPLLVQIWLFASPVVYPSTLIPEAWQSVYALNPMSSVIDGARWAMLGAPPPAVAHVVISVCAAIALMIGALAYFRRSEPAFADLI